MVEKSDEFDKWMLNCQYQNFALKNFGILCFYGYNLLTWFARVSLVMSGLVINFFKVATFVLF